MWIDHALQHLTEHLQAGVPFDRSGPFHIFEKMDERVNGTAAEESGCPLLTAAQSAKEGAAKKNFLQRADDEGRGHCGSHAGAQMRRGEIAVPATSVEGEGEESNACKRKKSKNRAASKLP